MSIRRVVLAWLALVVLMIANGMLRELALKPAYGPQAADIVSAIFGAMIMLAGTRIFFRPLVGRPIADLARVSGLFVGLTLAFEFSFGHYVDHKSLGGAVPELRHLGRAALARTARTPRADALSVGSLAGTAPRVRETLARGSAYTDRRAP
jgi:hypothetical protein